VRLAVTCDALQSRDRACVLEAAACSVPRRAGRDAAGNSYVLLSAQANFPVKNNLAICGPMVRPCWRVRRRRRPFLQATYVAGSQGQAALALASDPLLTCLACPTRLTRRRGSSQAHPAACGSCALFGQRPNTAGRTRLHGQWWQLRQHGNPLAAEIVSLFGEGIGPAAGTLPQVDLQTGFPKQLANVVVTFNGTPGPLLYVQNNQINAIAPWSLPTGQTVQICVTYNGNTTNCSPRPVSVFILGSLLRMALTRRPEPGWNAQHGGPTPRRLDPRFRFSPRARRRHAARSRRRDRWNTVTLTFCRLRCIGWDPTFFVGLMSSSLTDLCGTGAFEVAGASQINLWSRQPIYQSQVDRRASEC